MAAQDNIHYRTKNHPEANGRRPEHGEEAWNIYMPLENGQTLHIHMGKKDRDILFGMLIVDCHDNGEDETEASRDEHEK